MNRLLSLSLALGLTGSALAQQATSRTYLELDGVSQYLSVPAHSDLDILPGQSYSIALWMWGERTMIYGDPMRLVSRADVGKADSLNKSGYELWALRTTTKSFLGASLPNGAGTFTSSLSGWGASPKEAYLRHWYHVALVVDRLSGTIRLYVDGEEVLCKDKEVRAWVAANKLPLLIGAGSKDGKPIAHFAGRLDNVRLYARALSEEQVRTDLATDRIDPTTEGLVAAFDFDGYRSGDKTITDATGRHTATLHGFPEALAHEAIRTYTDTATNGHLIGRAPHQALRVLTLGLQQPDYLQALEVDLAEATAPKDIKSLKLYLTDNGDRYDHRSPGTLLAEGRPSGGKVVLRRVAKAPRIDAHSKLWLVADVQPRATEGHKLTTTIRRIELAQAHPFTPEAKATTHEIVLERTLVWTPTENSSAHYRIPAIVRLSNGHLVAAIDKRKTTDYDLPSDIDVEVKISTDNGKTWGRPITVAKGTPEHGYGDAAMATDGKNIYMVMVAGSGLWFYPSSASKPLEMYFTSSSDGGKTWAPVREITKEVYTDRYPNGGFFGSGNGIVTSRGRIAFVASMRIDEKWGGQMDNVLVYSDDRGKSWTASPVARANGDEAKVIELANGDLLISSRNRAWGKPTPRTYVLSSDHGHTWSAPAVWNDIRGNACNAALTRYSLASEGKGKSNILLHTIIEASTRVNLRIYMSEDEGKTWPYGNTICVGEAAYSEVTPLADGTIGILAEENDRPAYDIYFTRVSLDWIRKGGANPNK